METKNKQCEICKNNKFELHDNDIYYCTKCEMNENFVRCHNCGDVYDSKFGICSCKYKQKYG